MELAVLKPILGAAMLAALWMWESVSPHFAGRADRLRHGLRNLALAVLNTALMALLFAWITVKATGLTHERGWGLLNFMGWDGWARLVGALVLFDAWMYGWHRLNHSIPFLWRFHRVHHADAAMDATTGTRFHAGELALSALARLLIVPLLGMRLTEVLLYDTLALAVSQFHHANIGLGRWEGPLRWLVVTPGLHRVHHSRIKEEADSNYATLSPAWDRLFGSLRPESRCGGEPGIDGLDGEEWKPVHAMLRMPFNELVNR